MLCLWWDPWLRVAHLLSFLCCVFGGVRDSVLFISLVFCVVFLVGSVLLISLVSCVVFLEGSVTPFCPSSGFGGICDSVLLFSLVFCVVFLVGSVTPCCSSFYFFVLCLWWGPWLRVAHLFSFLCCAFGVVRDSVLLISLVFCVVFLVGSVTPCCSSFYFSVLCLWWGPWLRVAHLFSFLCCAFGVVRDSYCSSL